MRITLSEVASAFPELDGFSAEQRDRILSQARLHAGESPGCGCVMVGVVTVILMGGVVPMAMSAVLGEEGGFLGAMLVPGGIIVGALLGLVYRDSAMRRLLRDQIERTKCPACKGTMMGSARSADCVRCGGCGEVHRYAALGITPEDLGRELFVLTARSRCPGCGYAFAGLKPEEGRVKCPECGGVTAVVVEGEPVGAVVREHPGAVDDTEGGELHHGDTETRRKAGE